MAGKVTLPGAIYQVRGYVGDGVHAIQEIDPSGFPADAEAIPVDIADEALTLDAIMADDGSTIDVLVIYTQAARSAAGGTSAMSTVIDLAVSETNDSYANSGVNQRVRLVHAQEVNYSESDFDWVSTLYRLRDPADGYLDDVHALRDTYCADEVVMIVANMGYCGIAFMMDTVSHSFEGWAFSLVSYPCAAGHYTFAHELGHTMGARHDWYVDPTDNRPFSYNHGYVNTTDRWLTIMSYGTECADNGIYCSRLPYWSNPDQTYGGETMGVPEGASNAADNRKTLNSTAYTVSNFRPSCASTPVTDIKANGSDGPISLSAMDTLVVTVELDAGAYSGVRADWWCVADTEFGGWYYYNAYTDEWLPGFYVSYQEALYDLSPPFQVLSMSGLPTGSYDFYFGVDLSMDGTLDEGVYYDSVAVSLKD